MSYSLRWTQREGVTWRAMLDELIKIAESFARARGAQVTRERGDAPNLDIRWFTDNEIGRAIYVLIEGDLAKYELVFRGSAWKDIDDPNASPPRYRIWNDQELSRFDIPDPNNLTLILARFQDTLLSIYTIVSAWQTSQLTDRPPLPPTNANLTGKIVKGVYTP